MENETHTEYSQETPAPANKKSDLSISFAIVLAGLIIGGAILFSNNGAASVKAVGSAPAQQPGDTGAPAPIPVQELAIRPDDHVLGNPNANVLVIEYSDTECPFCKRFHETMIQLINQYGKDGQVAWVYRYFPLDQIHPKSRKEAEGLECANELGGNEAFWKYTEKIFAITPANNGLDPAQLPVIANSIGLDVAKFNACLSSGKYADRVEKDFESGTTVGVHGTPFTIMLNKKTGKQMTVEGAYPFESVKATLDAVIASQPTTK